MSPVTPTVTEAEPVIVVHGLVVLAGVVHDVARERDPALTQVVGEAKIVICRGRCRELLFLRRARGQPGGRTDTGGVRCVTALARGEEDDREEKRCTEIWTAGLHSVGKDGVESTY